MESENDIVVSLLEQLTDESFDSLLSSFHKPDCINGQMQVDAFQELLGDILRVPITDQRLLVLCKKIDIDGAGHVTENKLMSYLLQQLREREAIRTIKPLPFQDAPSFKLNTYSKQSSCSLLPVSSPPRFISVSKDGVITTWSTTLKLLKGTVMDDKATMVDRSTLARMKRVNLWITDSTVIPSYNMLIIATTSRELNFYDLSSNEYKFVYRLCDLPSVPLCIVSHTSSESVYVLYGDSTGSVTMLQFLNPSSSLFVPIARDTSSSSSDNVRLILYSRLSEHTQYVSLTVLSRIHQDWVQRVMYLPENHSVITCSTSSKSSLVLRDVNGKRKPYVFKLMKGISCFDYNFESNILVTGSPDHVVRFWDPYVPASPVSVGTVHTSPIVDVLIHKEMKLVYTFSRDLTLCVWDMQEYTILQTLPIKFPFTQKQPEFAVTILSQVSSDQLTIMCNEYVAVCSLSSTVSGTNSNSWTTHSAVVKSVLYEPMFSQVISGSEDGEILTWDIAAGTRVRSFKNCHGNSELTFMSLDTTGHRLITGSRGGEIKIWNHFDGECLNVMNTCHSTEVTGVIHVQSKSQFLATGWNRNISAFNDKSNTFIIKEDETTWTNGPHHKDDILTMSYCPPHYMATGSFDGDIIVWNIDTNIPLAQFKSLTQIRAAVNIKLQRQRSSLTNSRSEATSFTPSRSSSRLAKTRSSSDRFQSVPVDKVLFLKTRIQYRQTQGVLVTSEAGNGRFWSFPGKKEPLGSILLTMKDNENVLALTCDSNDQYLVTGDTTGDISVFDISKYCTGKDEATSGQLMSTWQAHAGEVLSVEYAEHNIRPLIVSGSADCTVKLWTIEGSHIGTFGQKGQWNISMDTTYCHIKESITVIRHEQQETDSSGNEQATTTATTTTKEEVVEIDEKSVDQKGPISSSELSITSSTVSLTGSSTSLSTSVFDNKLSDQYQNKVDQRMISKQERRQYIADMNFETTDKYGLLCSPFQALQLLDVSDPVVPGTISEFLSRR